MPWSETTKAGESLIPSLVFHTEDGYVKPADRREAGKKKKRRLKKKKIKIKNTTTGADHL